MYIINLTNEVSHVIIPQYGGIMRNFMIYLISIGLAFYAGFKLPKRQCTSVINKNVKLEPSVRVQVNAAQKATTECIQKYDDLVYKTNNKVKNLEAELKICHEIYFQDELYENLEPEKIKINGEPTLEGDYYGDY